MLRHAAPRYGHKHRIGDGRELSSASGGCVDLTLCHRWGSNVRPVAHAARRAVPHIDRSKSYPSRVRGFRGRTWSLQEGGTVIVLIYEPWLNSPSECDEPWVNSPVPLEFCVFQSYARYPLPSTDPSAS